MLINSHQSVPNELKHDHYLSEIDISREYRDYPQIPKQQAGHLFFMTDIKL